MITWILLSLALRVVAALLYREWNRRHPRRWLVQHVEPDYATNDAEARAFYYENGVWQ